MSQLPQCRNFVSALDNLAMSKKRKVMRIAEDNKLDEALYLWFIQRRSQGMPISGPILCEKALQLYNKLHEGEGESVSPFTASRGWLWRFCGRHGLRQLSVQGEKLSADSATPDPFKKQLQEIRNGT